jgi:hypothetical protein
VKDRNRIQEKRNAMKTKLEKKFEQFHNRNSGVYAVYVEEAKRLMARFPGRPFGGHVPLYLGEFDQRLPHVPKYYGKLYAFLAIQNGDLPAMAFAFRTYSKKVQ